MSAPPGSPRAGFTLVEVTVAVVVLSVGVLGASATAVLAGRFLREAHATERAIAAAALVLDSIVQLDTVQPGERELLGMRLHWAVRQDARTNLVELIVEYRDGTTNRRILLSARHSTPPPRLGGEP